MRLQAYMADNDAGVRSFTQIRFRLRRSQHLSRRAVQRKACQSTNIWILGDTSVLGSLDSRDAAIIFCIALSMQTWRFLWSPVLLNTVSEPEVEPTGMIGSLTIGHKSPWLTIYEDHVMVAAAALRNALQSGNKLHRAAIEAYWDGLHSVQRRSRFLNLFAALELAVNMDGSHERGAEFDKKVGRLTGASATDVQALRELNNRLKHAKARQQYTQPSVLVGKEGGDLKRLVDAAIARRFGFLLPPGYNR